MNDDLTDEYPARHPTGAHEPAQVRPGEHVAEHDRPDMLIVATASIEALIAHINHIRRVARNPHQDASFRGCRERLLELSGLIMNHPASKERADVLAQIRAAIHPPATDHMGSTPITCPRCGEVIGRTE